MQGGGICYACGRIKVGMRAVLSLAGLLVDICGECYARLALGLGLVLGLGLGFGLGLRTRLRLRLWLGLRLGLGLVPNHRKE